MKEWEFRESLMNRMVRGKDDDCRMKPLEQRKNDSRIYEMMIKVEKISCSHLFQLSCSLTPSYLPLYLQLDMLEESHVIDMRMKERERMVER